MYSENNIRVSSVALNRTRVSLSPYETVLGLSLYLLKQCFIFRVSDTELKGKQDEIRVRHPSVSVGTRIRVSMYHPV